MKKLLYCFAVAILGLVSCNTWDDEQTQNYGNGPAVSIDLVTTADSSFTFTVTPANETQFYSYAVVEGTEAEGINPTSLLKNTLGGIEGAIVNYSENATVTVNMRDAKNQPLCAPNTSYVIYAVAANDKGILGEVVSTVVKTTDGNAPVARTLATSGNMVIVGFSESVYAGTGEVSAKYYKQWDILNPVDVETDCIEVVIADNEVGFTVNDVPAGAYVTYSWEEGAFVDSFGNKCPAMNSGLDVSTGSLVGVSIHLANEPWNIEDANFTAPKAGSTFPKWEEFKGEIVFDEKVYVSADDFKAGDISIIYSNDSRTATYKLPLKNIDFGLDENNATQKVTFTLPQATLPGDKVSVILNEDVFFDVYGNGNEVYNSADDGIYWVAFAMTKDDFLGSFTFQYESYFDGKVDGGVITVKENPDEENGIIISDLLLEGLDLYGYYDMDECKIYIYQQYIGAVGPYFATFENAAENADIAITVNANGTMETEDWFGIYLYGDAEYTEELGWYEVSVSALFTKTETAEASSRAYKVNNWTPRKASFKHTKNLLFRK